MVGEAAARTVDWLVVVGAGAAGIAEGAVAAGWTERGSSASATPRTPSRSSRPRLRDGDVVLLKASRGIGLDRVVDGLRRLIGDGTGR